MRWLACLSATAGLLTAQVAQAQNDPNNPT